LTNFLARLKRPVALAPIVAGSHVTLSFDMAPKFGPLLPPTSSCTASVNSFLTRRGPSFPKGAWAFDIIPSWSFARHLPQRRVRDCYFYEDWIRRTAHGCSRYSKRAYPT